MPGYAHQLRNIVRAYIEEHVVAVIDPVAVARWATERGLLKPRQLDINRFLARQISRALRGDTFIDRQGRKVRSKHVVVRNVGGVQTSLWGDMRQAPREHMQISFQQRRRQIVGDCCQLKTDMDSYNDNCNNGEQLKLSFDFTVDLKEAELMKPMNTSQEQKPMRPPAGLPRLKRLPSQPSLPPNA